ncbi:MAG: thiamine phosphate synthase [Tagaea sp. CACIAM 22H2]|nr:thiamine phosphate synthase [Tagaea sp. CACIAM 22H2]
MARAKLKSRLYLITPPDLDPAAFSRVLDKTLAAGAKSGIVASLQLRLKDVDDAKIGAAIETLMPIAHNYDVAFILNDRPDLAAKYDCDGVHVGQEDTPYAEARATVGADRIVGVTCHDSKDLAFDAAEAGADYVAFGAFFPSTTKTAPKSHADVELIEAWTSFVTVPCVAIGGITPENCGPLVAAGADFLAVAGAVWNHEGGPEAAIAAFENAVKSAA